MSIIWLVENPGLGPVVRDWLIGNFPTRNFASASSLLTLARQHQGSPPDFIVCNVRDCALTLQLSRLDRESNVPCMYVDVDPGENDARLAFSREKLVTAPWSSPGYLALVTTIQRTLAAKNERIEADVVVNYRGYRLDLVTGSLNCEASGHYYPLTNKELKLLHSLMLQAEEFMPREALYEKVWGATSVSPRTLDAHVSKLRKLLQNCGLNIESTYGGGYRLCCETAA